MRGAVVPALAAAVLVVSGLSNEAVQAAKSDKRLALVIGNSSYQNVLKLTNPANDAADIAEKLKALQFEVLLATDADRSKMAALLQDFASRLTRDHVALVFYAGHGVTVNNESFLLPVDVPAVIELEENYELGADAMRTHLVSMASVLSPLEASKIGILFLDACRTNAADPGLGLNLRVVDSGTNRAVPIMRGAGSSQIRPSPYSAGVFRAYATQLDNAAADGTGRNSPFTKALLAHITTKGISIQEMMMRVRKSVMEETRNQQVPWEEAALNETFSFVPGALTLPPSPGARSRPLGGPSRSGPAVKVPDRKSSGTSSASRSRSSRPKSAARSSGGRPSSGRSSLPPNLGGGVGAGL